MGQVEVIAALEEHGEMSIKEMDKLIDDMSLSAIRQAVINLSRWGLVESRRIKNGSYGPPNKYRLKEHFGV